MTDFPFSRLPSWLRVLVVWTTLTTTTGINAQETPPESALPEEIQFLDGGENAVKIRAGEGWVVVYGMPAGMIWDPVIPEALLMTHGRRDVVEAARRSFPTDEAESRLLVAPERSREFLEGAEQRWTDWWTARFDYKDQQVTQWPTSSLPADRYVKEGDVVEVSGLSFTVMETPGVTRDGVTYLAEIGGKRVAFTGNLLWEGGRVFDLYSFQEAVPEAKVGCYHGYAGRFGPWIDSLRRLAAAKPDVLVPSQGPLITDPAGDIARAIERAQAIYANYISTNALHWYFGEERMRASLEKVLGPGANMESMPLCEHIDLPDWCQHIGTTKLLVSKDGYGFVLDVGMKAALPQLQEAVAQGLVKGIEGIWVTHLHNDHTQFVREAKEAFGCPVYGIREVADGLARPREFFTPYLTANAVPEMVALEDGHTWQWREFKLTARYFPGQMYDHGGLLVERPDHEAVFFIGDSFSPSGIDDYCLMNQNLPGEDEGYLRCFKIVRDELPKGTWLVNQHIPHLFRFNEQELDYLEGRYRERIQMIADFVPWDAAGYAVDEQWAWFFPYGQEVKAGETAELSLKVRNHSAGEREFSVEMTMPEGIRIVEPGLFDPQGISPLAVFEDIIPSVYDTIPPGKAIRFPFRIEVEPDVAPGIYVVRGTIRVKQEYLGADQRRLGYELPDWCAALVKVTE